MLKTVQRWHVVAFVFAIVALSAASCTKKTESTPGSPTSCTVTVGAPSANTFGAEGGSATISVTAPAGCSWTAVSNAAFITISQGATGNGNGTVQIAVAANTGGDRTGTVTVAGGSPITIAQRGPVAAPVTIAAPTAMSPSGGQILDVQRATLVVGNAAVTGNAGTVTYRFELADLPTFFDDPNRTFIREGVPQGAGGTTSASIERDLAPGVQWYWRARATNGSVTSAYSNVETFRTASRCGFTLSTNTVNVSAAGGTATITVTAADSSCTWTAVSNFAFITVTSGASGTGSGTVTLNVAPNNTGAARGGTVTIANQTVTVNQSTSQLVASFRLVDPGRQPGPTTECQIRSLTSVATTCVLESTSFPLGATGIVQYDWTVQYSYPGDKTLSQSGSNSSFSFTESCGQSGSSDNGNSVDLRVTLTITDNAGNTATVTSSSGSQPALSLRAFTCGQ